MKTIKILLLLLITSNTIAQTPNTQNQTPIDSATLYLTGTFKNYNPQKAFQINLQNANNGNAKSMNALAMQYTKGLGVDSNFTLAVYWFNQAAINGYNKALVNVGMLYKHQATDSTGYSIACSYFNQALQTGEPSAFFAQGYMYYKGLGCTQNYTTAITLFNQGIAHNRADCMYFKALCFKYGYGITTNTDSANYYFNTAALKGYQQANYELLNTSTTTTGRTRNEQSTNDLLTKNDKLTNNEPFINIPTSKKLVQLNGNFIGNLNQYDYSGKKLLAQIPINLQVSTNKNIITGNLIFNHNQSIQLNAIQQGNQLIFSQTTITNDQLTKNETNEKQKTRNKSKRETRNEKLIFHSANLQIETKADTNYLTGTLQLFNTYTHETEKPINIKLTQQNKQTDNPKPQTPNNIAVSPNPNKGNFNISFNLPQSATVKININNPQGQVVYSKIWQQLPQGKQSVAMPNIKGGSGIYTATLFINGSQNTIAFIKE